MRSSFTIPALLALAGCMHGPMHGTDGAHGMTRVASAHDVKTTLDRFEAAAKSRGLVVFNRIDHAGGAQKINQSLRPTELLIFGNPQGGTPLMQCQQSVGIDLPLKALAWQDAQGRVWLGYNEPMHLAHRHGLGECGAQAVGTVTKALAGLAAEATRK